MPHRLVPRTTCWHAVSQAEALPTTPAPGPKQCCNANWSIRLLLCMHDTIPSSAQAHLTTRERREDELHLRASATRVQLAGRATAATVVDARAGWFTRRACATVGAATAEHMAADIGGTCCLVLVGKLCEEHCSFANCRRVEEGKPRQKSFHLGLVSFCVLRAPRNHPESNRIAAFTSSSGPEQDTPAHSSALPAATPSTVTHAARGL